LRPLLNFGSIQRHWLASPVAFDPEGFSRLPGFASPSTFPSHRFSRPQGFTSRKLWWPYLMPPPHIGFSPTELFPRKVALERFPVQCLLDVTCWHMNPRETNNRLRGASCRASYDRRGANSRLAKPSWWGCVNTLTRRVYATPSSDSGLWSNAGPEGLVVLSTESFTHEAYVMRTVAAPPLVGEDGVFFHLTSDRGQRGG